MKKVFLSALAICGIMAANAQVFVAPGGSESKVSTATNTKAGSVTSEFDLKLKVYNIIRIKPNENFDFSATFNEAAELDGTKYLDNNSLIPGSIMGDLFLVSSNRKFHVDMTAGAVTVHNKVGEGNSNMPLNVFEYKVSSTSSGVALASNDWENLAATQPLITAGDAGKDRGFGLRFRATPGWNYEGGEYKVPITVTATQD